MNVKNSFLPLALAPLALAVAFLTGCNRQEPAPQPAPQPAPGQPEAVAPQVEAPEEEVEPMEPDRLGELFMKADSLYMEGSTNEALASLEQGLADPELANDRQQIFSMLVRMFVYAGRIDDARARMLEACRKEPALAQEALGVVYSHYAEGVGDQKAAAEWTEEVLAIPELAPAIRRPMREWNYLSHVRLDDAEKVIELSAGLLRDAPAGDAVVILQRGIDLLFDRKRSDVVEQILAQAGKTITSDASTRSLVESTRLRLLATQAKWDALAKALPSAAASLPDGDLQRVLRRVLAAATIARATSPSVDDLCLIIINGFTNKLQSVAIAARQWTDNAVRESPAELPERLGLLLNRQFPTQILCNIFLHHFYDVIEDPAVVMEMKDIGDRLLPLAPDDDTRNSIRTMVLDSCFLVEDYDGALKILHAGIAGYDKPWHDMAIAKVEAHKALKENRPLDAIKSFRAFMATVEVSKENDAADPSTGIVHTKTMILGRNAKRIGDIYRDQVKDAEAAKAAYAEARKYYQEALASKPEPEAVQVIQAEMAEIPQ